MKKFLAFILTIFLIFTLSIPAFAATEGKAITSYEDLKSMEGSTGKFYLAKDITVPSSASAISPIAKFNGTFDGNGKKISGLKIKATATAGGNVLYGGLFAVIGGSGTVENLTLENVTVECTNVPKGYAYVGIIAGKNSGSIRNCRVSGNISVNAPDATVYVGGIVGSNEKRAIQLENFAHLNIKAAAVYAGGISGDHRTTNHALEQCINNGDVIVSGEKSDSFGGGIVGKSSYTVVNCANYGTVSVFSDIDSHSGGIVGLLSSGSITRCYNAGKIHCESARESFWDAIVGKTQTDHNTINCYFLSASVQGKADSEVNADYVVSSTDASKEDSFKRLDFDVTWEMLGGKLSLQNITAAMPKVSTSQNGGQGGTVSYPQGSTGNPQGGESSSQTPEDEYIPPVGVEDSTTSGNNDNSDSSDNIDDNFIAKKALPVWIFVIIAVLAAAGICVFLYRYNKKN